MSTIPSQDETSIPHSPTPSQQDSAQQQAVSATTPSGSPPPTKPYTSLDEFLKARLSDVSHNISSFNHLSHCLIVSHTETIASVLTKLHERRARSAVVARYIRRWGLNCNRSPTPESPRGPEVLLKQKLTYSLSVHYSFFDVRDLCYYVMRIYQDNPCRSVEDILDLVRNQKVGKIANLSGRVPFVPYQYGDSVGTIVAAFGPCCRVPIFRQNELLRIMTPSDLLALLMSDGIIQQIEKKQNIDIRSVAKRDFMTIGESDSLLKAISLMERHGFSAIPIVSDRNLNEALDVITVKDIKFLLTAQEHFEGKDVLNAPALSYVRVLRKPSDQSKAEWAFVSDHAPLDEIFGIFTKTNAHRLVLRNDAGLMTGLLTLTDMMRKLAEALPTLTQQQKSQSIAVNK